VREALHNVLQVVFFLSMLFAIYTLAGYPLLLALLARLWPLPVRKRPLEPTVTVLLPVRNGEHWLRGKLQSLLALDYPRERINIIVISDGSTDRTDLIAAEFFASGRVELLRTPGGGKAVALNTGLERACGEVLFFTDVRQQLAPESLRNLVACFADPAVGAVSGELVIHDGETHEEVSVGLYWKYEKWLRRRESRLHSVMGTSGCIYAMRRELAVPLPPGTLVDDMYLPLTAFFRGYRIILEESAKAHDYPTELETEFRRKVRTQAGVYQIIRWFPRLLVPHRMWLVFFSHKLARLLLPFALLLAALSTPALDPPWRTPAFLAQALFYGVALFDVWIPNSFPCKRLSAALRSFIVLLAAAFCAAFVLFRPSEHVWKETRVRSARPAP
jgi:cellulose synthase/poly-beta-1,6-N-acetylglucosamine synthase-like glycosyltransferase